MKKEHAGILQMIICAMLWSIAGIFLKLLPWNGLAAASLRSLFAGITISIYMIIRHYRFSINRETLRSGILTGCVYLCFSVANKLTTAANAIVLQFTAPVFIVIFSSVFYKKKIRKTDLALIKALANKGYYLTVLSRVRAEYAVISRFLKTYPAEHGEDIYPKLSEDRKPLVDPYWEPADVFLERWLREEYPRKGFREDDPYYVTERGERVRSKSELIIANWLFQHGIPYRYECALELWDPKQPRRITIYPDFTILDPATGKCFYLEHLGMMEDERYFRSAMDRISLYEANGYFVGESLLLSFESDKVPLDVRTLGRRVEHALGRDS